MAYPVEFIEARIAEDRALAKATTFVQPYDIWDAVGVQGSDDIALANWRVVGIAIPALEGKRRPGAKAVMRHIALHDPERVLRECAIRTRVLERHRDCGDHSGYCGDGGHDLEWGGCADLLDLAATWSGHGDYQGPATVDATPGA